MGKIFEMQPRITVQGQTLFPGFIQPQDQWVDVSRYENATVRMELSCLTATGGPGTPCLYVEGSDDPGGYFVSCVAAIPGQVSTTPITERLKRAVPYGASGHLYNVLRWKVTGSGGDDWTACFRITLDLK